MSTPTIEPWIQAAAVEVIQLLVGGALTRGRAAMERKMAKVIAKHYQISIEVKRREEFSRKLVKWRELTSR